MNSAVNIIDTLHAKYNAIPQYYRRSFFQVFFITTFVFSGIIMWNLFGNHDYLSFFRGISWKHVWFVGRPFASIPIQLTNGFILPLTTILGFFFYSLAALFFCVLFKLPQRKGFYTLVGLVITLHPYFLGKIYYGFMLESYLGLAVIFGGFLLYTRKISHYRLYTFLCCFLVIGMSQTFLNTISITFILLLMVDICFENKKWQELFSHYMQLAVIILSACILFLIFLEVSKFFGFILTTYNNKINSISDMLANAPTIILGNMTEYISLQIPMPLEIKIVGIALVVFAVCIGFLNLLKQTESKSSKIVLFLLCVLYIFCFHNIVAFITPNFEVVQGASGFRILFHGLLYVYAFAVIVLLRSEKLWVVNMTLVLSAVFVWWFAIADFRAQQVWKMRQNIEYHTRNRILSRIEINENFDLHKSYAYIQIGEVPAWSNYIYNKRYKLKTLELTRAYGYDGNQGAFFRLLMPTHRFSSPALNSLEWKKLLLENKELLQGSNEWPAKNSVFVTEDAIFVIFNKQTLDAILNSEENADKTP